MLRFICYPKCSTCQDAKALLDSYNAVYETRNIQTDNPSYDELKALLESSGLKVRKLFNKSGSLYRSLKLKEKLPTMSEDECLRLLATDGMLVKRPLLIGDHFTLVGFKPDAWMSVFTGHGQKMIDAVFVDFSSDMLQVVESREGKGNFNDI